MDGQRFDQFTRLVATGRSRRSLLRAIGAAIAGVSIGVTHRSVLAGCAEGNPCSTSADCCGELTCEDNLCAATCLGIGTVCNSTTLPCCSGACLFEIVEARCGACTTEGGSCNGVNSVCCSDLLCDEDFHICSPPPTCLGLGYTCVTDGIPCCDGYACNDSNDCCALPDSGCTDSNDCCEVDDNPGSGFCIGGFCTGGTLACVADSGECTADEQCCDDGNCYLGYCTHECKVSGFACTDNEDCCEGYVCGQFDTCTPAVCRESGADCAFDNDCCDELICDGETCVACRVAGGACEDHQDCCSGFVCDDGLGQCVSVFPCQDENDECEESAHCCGDLVCDQESNSCVVADPGTCGETGDTCSGNGDCCGELVCTSGACAAASPTDGEGNGNPDDGESSGGTGTTTGGVTQLPTTGLGQDDASNALTATLLAASAALAAGTLLRKKSDPEPADSLTPFQ